MSSCRTATCSLQSGDALVSEAGSFYPPDVIKQYEKGETFPSMVGDVRFRPEDHQLIRPVIIVRGKSPKEMKNPEDFWEVLT